MPKEKTISERTLPWKDRGKVAKLRRGSILKRTSFASTLKTLMRRGASK